MPPDVSLCPAKTLTRDLRNGHLAYTDILLCSIWVVYLYPAGNSSCPKTRYNAPFTTCVRGLCHGIPSRFLPARADRPGVVVPDTLWAVAIGACCSSPNDTQAAAAPIQALQKAQALSGSHPYTLLRCL